MELFALYKYAFILCLLAGMTLCLHGSHLVARRESLQVLALAQGALVGNLLGRLILPQSEIGSIFFSLIIFLLLKFFFAAMILKNMVRETFFVVAYISLLSISYFIITLFPGLEGHMSVGFFGDIVSLSEKMTIVLMILFLFFFAILLLNHQNMFKRTFEKSVLGIKKNNYFEEAFFALIMVCSLYGLGFLFTVAAMIFPAVIIGLSGKNLKVVLYFSIAAASASALIGLGASIVFERLSTVPTQILLMLVILSILGFLLRKLKGESCARS